MALLQEPAFLRPGEGMVLLRTLCHLAPITLCALLSNPMGIGVDADLGIGRCLPGIGLAGFVDKR